MLPGIRHDVAGVGLKRSAHTRSSLRTDVHTSGGIDQAFTTKQALQIGVSGCVTHVIPRTGAIGIIDQFIGGAAVGFAVGMVQAEVVPHFVWECGA